MAKKPKAKQTPAVLVVHGMGKMTSEQRKDIAVWLRDQAKNFLKDGDLYSDKRFRATFSYY